MKKLAEKIGVSDRVLEDIHAVAKKYEITRILLFGSRARGDYQKKSDIDLAVYGCKNFTEFMFSMEEDVWTLLEFDLINMDDVTVSEELQEEIKKDGVLIYEKV